MSKEEKEQEAGFSVNDKRRFTMDENGKVIDKSETTGEPDEKPQPEEKTITENDEMKKAEEECSSRQDWKDLPQITFSTLILSLSTQAMIGMGEIPDPMTGEPATNLAMAKQTIDLIGVLKEKTKGNLSKEEEQFLQANLTDLRLRFVGSCKG